MAKLKPRKPISPEAWQACEADWLAGALPLRAMSERHGIPVSSIAARFAGVARDAGDTKRALVRAAASGNPVQSLARASVVAAATLDAEVMSDFAKGAAIIGERFRDNAADCPISLLPGFTKSAKDAIEIFRKARELDSTAESDPLSMLIDVTRSRLRPAN